MSAYNDPPTARQLDYGAALGIRIPINVNRTTMSSLIDEAHKALNGPPVLEQVELARSLCIQIPASLTTRRQYTDCLYQHLVARRWVYSVLRHIVGAKWRLYSESGMPEFVIAQIATALKANQPLFDTVRDKTPGNSETGADVWMRISSKAVNTPEYQLVKNHELPDDVAVRVAEFHRHRASAPRVSRKRTVKGESSGCMGLVLITLIVGLVSAVAAHAFP